MIIPTVFWLVPIASIVALGMAFFFFRQMMAEDEGTLHLSLLWAWPFSSSVR